jgi:hypothetical protein
MTTIAVAHPDEIAVEPAERCAVLDDQIKYDSVDVDDDDVDDDDDEVDGDDDDKETGEELSDDDEKMNDDDDSGDHWETAWDEEDD